jgi:hypothetical protein
LKDYNLEDKPGQVIGIFAAILRWALYYTLNLSVPRLLALG